MCAWLPPRQPQHHAGLLAGRSVPTAERRDQRTQKNEPMETDVQQGPQSFGGVASRRAKVGLETESSKSVAGWASTGVVAFGVGRLGRGSARSTAHPCRPDARGCHPIAQLWDAGGALHPYGSPRLPARAFWAQDSLSGFDDIGLKKVSIKNLSS